MSASRPQTLGEEIANSITHGLGLAASVVALPALLVVATRYDTRSVIGAAVFGTTLVLLYGASTMYHALAQTRARNVMRIIDHSAIFLLIAGTYTPFALLVLHGSLADVVLAVMWSGAVGGILLKLLWIDAPKRLAAVIYVALGSVAVAVTPDMVGQIGVVASILVVVGGILYTLGAVTYALRRPDPVPAVFGYHEVFHALVIVAAALQYAVIAFWVLPQA